MANVATSMMVQERLAKKIGQIIDSLSLKLEGAVVLTEAATGPFVVTPVIAAMAGADHVYAMTRDSQYGTVAEVIEQTMALSQAVDCADRIQVITDKMPEIVGQADIVTNSGHLRPISREMISWMKPTAVIPLMYESWEFRSGDLDLEGCRQRGIPVAGTSEEHPMIGVFNYLGIAVIKQLLHCGIEVFGSKVLLLCNNRFASYIENALTRCGANVTPEEEPANVTHMHDSSFDAVVVAMTPCSQDIIGRRDALVNVGMIQNVCPGGPVIQFWGDIDRAALDAADIRYYPLRGPSKGHMGVLLSDVGQMPVLRLQTGGLKVAEIMWREMIVHGDYKRATDAVVQSGYGQYLF